MLIKQIQTKTKAIYIFHNGIEIFCKISGYKKFYIGYNLIEAKRKFKEQLKTESN